MAQTQYLKVTVPDLWAAPSAVLRSALRSAFSVPDTADEVVITEIEVCSEEHAIEARS